MATRYLFQISNTPAALTRMVDLIRPERYDEAIGEDRFTLREVIAHLADWEEIWLDRITAAVEYPGATIAAINEADRAVEHKYSQKDIHHELEVFENRRRDTTDYLLRLAEDDWSNTVVHSERGPMTVREIVEYVLGHDMYHVFQVSEYLKVIHA